MLKKFILIFFGCSLFFFLNAFAVNKSSETELNRVVAIINKDVITQTSLNHQLSIIKSQARQAHAPIPSEKKLRDQVLQQMINRQLQLQAAKNAGIEVGTLELNKALKNIAAQNHMTLDQFYKSVQKNGWTIADFRQEIKEEIITQKLQAAELGPKVKITHQEAQNLIQKREQSPAAKLYHLQDIFVAVSENATPQQINEAHQKAERVLVNLKAQKNFKKVAIEAAKSDSSIHVGDMGWRSIAGLPKPFVDKIAKMQKGQISNIMRTPNGFHILKLIDNPKLTKQAKITENQANQILFQRKLNDALGDFISKLRNEAYIKIM